VKYLSVCSGIEAATVAWHSLGWEPVAFSEIDKFPSAVLEARYPDITNLGDMTEYETWSDDLLVEVDVLVGGTPCQAFSVAGRKQSLSDDRGNLSLVFCELYHHINDLRRRHGKPPAIVVWENVPGVLNTKDNAFGCFLAGILGCDEAIETEEGKWNKAGVLCTETFRICYRVLDAQYFGVAQRRRRVFLVAVPEEIIRDVGEDACPSQILSLRESMCGNPPSRLTEREDAAGTAADSTQKENGELHVSNDPAHAVRTANGHGIADDVTHTIDGAQGQAVAFRKSRRASSVSDYETWKLDERTNTLNGFEYTDVRTTQAIAEGFTYSGASNQPAWMTGERTDCIPATGHSAGSHQGVGVVEGELEVRRLTVNECEMLQGFPAGYTDIEYRGKPAADNPRYRAIGNSMAVPNMHWIGYRIDKAIQQS
jgi:DNA (cytosine-5)-methyltransferase 1